MAKQSDREARQARERLRAYQARQTVHQHRIRRRRRDNWIALVGVVVVAALAVAAQLAYFGVGPGKPAAEPTPVTTPTPTATPTNSGDVPSPTIAEDRTWTGTLTLNKTIKLGIELDGKAAPQAVSSEISLIQKGYYTGFVCHRLTTSDSFKVLQCGGGKDAATAGTGSPGYSYGPIENAPADGVYKKGVIAMARQSDNGYSMGSQFFIVYGDTTIPADSAGGYSVIGTVTSGLDDLIAKIASKGTADGTSDGQPKVPTTITSVTIK